MVLWPYMGVRLCFDGGSQVVGYRLGLFGGGRF